MAKPRAKSASVRDMNKIAADLSHTRENIAKVKEQHALELRPLEQVEAILKVQLIEAMNNLELKSVTAASGESYHIATTYEFEFKDDGMGLKLEAYAKENNLLRPDKIAVRQSLRAKFEKDALPPEVEAFEKQTITVKKARELENTEINKQL